ncbi:hypothetical protein TNCV_4428821 [Trichonephila clavipes]|nr:hypothetical protein TNCV_4428821 [Trichonephila clavipes]
MNKSAEAMPLYPFLISAGCHSVTRWVHRWWIMERLSKEQKQRQNHPKPKLAREELKEGDGYGNSVS